jgi:hypothetical protein
MYIRFDHNRGGILNCINLCASSVSGMRVEETPESLQVHGEYALIIDYGAMDEGAQTHLAYFTTAGEANTISEALTTALAGGCALFDVRIAQEYLRMATERGWGDKITLTNLVRASAQMNWDMFQDHLDQVTRDITEGNGT